MKKFVWVLIFIVTLCSIGFNIFCLFRWNSPQSYNAIQTVQGEYYNSSLGKLKIRRYEDLPEKAIIPDESAAQEIARAYMETVLQKDEKQLSILKTTYQQDYNVWVVEAKPFKMAPWSSAFVVLDKTSGTVINAG